MDFLEILFKCAEITQKLAFLSGLIFITKVWRTPSFSILIYLGLVLVIEFFGERLANDQWMYNMLGAAELLAVTYMLYFSVKERLSKKVILIICCCCILFLVVDFIFLTKMFVQFLSYAFGIISVSISVMCFIYLYEIAKTDKVLNQYTVLQYWLCIGLLVFHLCNLPITVLINKLYEVGNIDHLLGIQSMTSIIMYSCFIIGFIWSKRKYNV